MANLLLHVAAASDPVMCDGQVEDKAPAARCVPEVAFDLHVAAHPQPVLHHAGVVSAQKGWTGEHLCGGDAKA